MRRENWMPGEHSWICSKHFLSGTKSNNPELPNYVPSVFPHTKSPEERRVEEDVDRRKTKSKVKKRRLENSVSGTKSNKKSPDYVLPVFPQDKSRVERRVAEDVDGVKTRSKVKRRRLQNSETQAAAMTLLEFSDLGSGAVCCGTYTMTDLSMVDIGTTKQHKLENDYHDVRKENERLKEENHKLMEACTLLKGECQQLKGELKEKIKSNDC